MGKKRCGWPRRSHILPVLPLRSGQLVWSPAVKGTCTGHPRARTGLWRCPRPVNIFNFPVSASTWGAASALVGRIAEALPLLDQMLERVATGKPYVLPCARARRAE